MNPICDDEICELLLQELDAAGTLHITISARELAERHHLTDAQKRRIVNFLVSRHQNPGGYVQDTVLISGRSSGASYRVGRKPQYLVKRKTLFTH